MANHLSWIDNGKPSTGVNDQLPNANLFYMKILKDNYKREVEESNDKNEICKVKKMPCIEWYMMYLQPKADWREPFKKYLKYGNLLTMGTT